MKHKHLGSIFSTTPTDYLTKKEIEERRKLQKELYQEILEYQKKNKLETSSPQKKVEDSFEPLKEVNSSFEYYYK